MSMLKAGNPKGMDLDHCYMIGMLAMGEEYYPNIGELRNPVTPMKSSQSVAFFVRVLSPEPEPIRELDAHMTRMMSSTATHLYIGIDRPEAFPPGFFGPDYYYMDPFKRSDYVQERLEGKLLLFRPVIRKDTKIPDRWHKNLEIITLEDYESSEEAYYMPVITASMDPDHFEACLARQEPIYFPSYGTQMAPPQYIRCGDTLYCSQSARGWKPHPSKPDAWLCQDPKSITKRQVSEDFASYIVSEVSESLAFYESIYLEMLESQPPQPIQPLQPVQPAAPMKPISLPKPPAFAKPAIAAKDWTPPSNASELELRFLETLENRALQQKLHYHIEDLHNFHMSVKTNDLTILSGMSGTGKTKLAIMYAESLGLSSEQLLILPVSPSYTEPGDVLGFLNASNGMYVPAETGLVDFLLHAQAYPNEMHMAIFDEMNLSQVEHWFANFLSLLEMDEGERVLRLYSEKAGCLNSGIYPPEIVIGRNVLFVGTVNMDETTKDFSDRLLDRANMVTLKKQSFIDLRKKLQEKAPVLPSGQGTPADLGRTSVYRSWASHEDTWLSFTEADMAFFDELHRIISKTDSQKGVSFRVLNKIGRYLSNIPCDAAGQPLLCRQVAMDLQLKQRILTKIRGSIDQYGKLVGTCRSSADFPPESSELHDFLESEAAKQISSFELSRAEIRRKARELYLHGYTH